MSSSQRVRFHTVPRMSREAPTGDVIAGVIELVRPCRNISEGQRMFVHVYRTTVEHYVVLIPVLTDDPPIAINLRRCVVKPVPDGKMELLIKTRSGEGEPLMFRILSNSRQVFNDWIVALTYQSSEGSTFKRTVNPKPYLPVLQESDEEMQVTN